MKINRTQKIFKASRIILLIGAGILFITLTNPQELPSVFLVIPFMLMFTVIYWSTIEFLHFWYHGKSVSPGLVNAVHPRRIALLIAATPTVLLVLQSIGQLTVRDLVTVVLIFSLAYFYLIRLSATTK